MELVTKRLRLREYQISDIEDILAYEADPEVLRYVCWDVATRESLYTELSWHIEQQSALSRRFFHLAIALRPARKAIGFCGLELISKRNREAELGYALHRSYWGRGFMTEATTAWLNHGFQSLNLHRIFAEVNPANAGSIRVLQKLGMRYEGTYKQQKWCRDHWRDVAVYAILADEWI